MLPRDNPYLHALVPGYPLIRAPYHIQRIAYQAWQAFLCKFYIAHENKVSSLGNNRLCQKPRIIDSYDRRTEDPVTVSEVFSARWTYRIFWFFDLSRIKGHLVFCTRSFLLVRAQIYRGWEREPDFDEIFFTISIASVEKTKLLNRTNARRWAGFPPRHVVCSLMSWTDRGAPLEL